MSTPTPIPPDAAQAPHAVSIRLYVTHALVAHEDVSLSAAQAHYLGNVMRRSAGDRVRLFNGIDGEHMATIVSLRRDQWVVRVGARLRAQADETDTWLCFAMLKRGPTNLVVQKATELGVAAILPLFTTHTQADRFNLERLRLVAIEAAEQSERLSIPALHPPRALNAVLAEWPRERRLVACIERSSDAPVRRGGAGPDGLLIGPEGGFSEAELDALRATAFVEAASLGPRILRAETAAIVGLALLQAA